MEDDYTHPGFLDQPFVRVPRQEPNEDIDFRAGEVIYENPKVAEWGRLGVLSTISLYFYYMAFWPIASLYKTHIPSPEMLFSRLDQFKMFSIHEVDKFNSMPIVHSVSLAILLYLNLGILNTFSKNFVTKLQYNRNKDLLFVTSLNEFGSLKEKTYELSNIERVVRADKASLRYSSEMEGFMVLKCLSSKDILVGNVAV